MKTTKTISNISYNSPEFIKATIDHLVNNGTLSHAYWIRHKAEGDDKKDHTHITLFPNGRVDTDKLRKEFMEIDLQNPTAPPLCVTPVWKTVSSTDDNILYNEHDEDYLAFKGQTREHHYKKSDFVRTDDDAFNALYDGIDRRKYMNLVTLIRRSITDGTSLLTLVEHGLIPARMYTTAKMMYNDAFNELKGFDPTSMAIRVERLQQEKQRELDKMARDVAELKKKWEDRFHPIDDMENPFDEVE